MNNTTRQERSEEMDDEDARALIEVFGEPISTYTRAQALEDGFLVDVSSVAREAGIKWPVALTREVWADCIEWEPADSQRQTPQDEAGRLWDVLWMASLAMRRASHGQALLFRLYRVPRGGRGIRPRLVTLKIIAGPGDRGEPVVTILTENQD